MSQDLIFHVVSRRKWKSQNKGGNFKPDTYSVGNEIECVTAENLNNYLNERFNGRKNLLIIVIDKYRLANSTRRDKETGKVYIEHSINIDAILDKIRIDAGKEGKFDVTVSAD